VRLAVRRGGGRRRRAGRGHRRQPGAAAPLRTHRRQARGHGHQSTSWTTWAHRNRDAQGRSTRLRARCVALRAHSGEGHRTGRTPDGGPFRTSAPTPFQPTSRESSFLGKRSPQPPPTSGERGMSGLYPLREVGTKARRTSQGGPRVQRVVIECFPPSCHVDIVAGGELVTATTRDTVDSILAMTGGGTVQDRGETCRTERTRPPRGA
jgi:hypothetical protein